MSKYLIDTNIFVDLLRDNLDIQNFSVKGDLATCSITLCELYYGAEKTSKPSSSIEGIESLTKDLNLRILDFDENTSKIFAKIKIELEKIGQRLEDFDLMIAATAIQNDMVLVTNNLKHFKRIKGLKIWTQ
ncbi:MAG: type II toxin-antitoxin system VapC family toxin [bacterium]|nr:MAG: type II toxin-antitoxin system VapC family toxin [bacterium]